MVLLHTPWRQRFDDNQDFVTLFHDLIESTDCPSFLKIPYLRIKARVLQKKIFLEPTNTADDIMSPFLSTAVSDDLKEIIKLAHMRPPNATHWMHLVMNFHLTKGRITIGLHLITK